MRRDLSTLLFALLLFALAAPGHAQPGTPWYGPALGIEAGDRILGARYAQRRLNWGVQSDARLSLRLQNRVQSRYVNPYDGDPRTLPELAEQNAEFLFRRVRTIATGQAGTPALTYHAQYDWLDEFLRDVAISYRWSDAAELWIGRGKVIFNDERIVSSGRQQFVNRSIVSDLFSVDRQQGMQLHGRLFADSPADLNYMLGVFGGRGVGKWNQTIDKLMYAGRLRWNLVGEPLPLVQSDTAMSEEPAASITVGFADNRTPCTAFVSQPRGCTSLPGFTPSTEARPGRFDVTQGMLEGKFRWRGVALVGELHVKDVTDRQQARSDPAHGTTLVGGYLQGGVMAQRFFPELAPKIELAGRYAYLDQDDPAGNDHQQEISAAVNWFIDDHEHKVSADVSRLTVADPVRQQTRSSNRLRVLWELRF